VWLPDDGGPPPKYVAWLHIASVCVCAYIYIYIYIYIYMCVYIYIYMCVCVCVCVRERERERETDRQTARENERDHTNAPPQKFRNVWPIITKFSVNIMSLVKRS
jgi:hypothetical protein